MKDDLSTDYTLKKWMKLNRNIHREVFPAILSSIPKAVIIALIFVGAKYITTFPAERIPVKDVSLYPDDFYPNKNVSVKYIGSDNDKHPVLIIKKQIDPVSTGLEWFGLALIFLVPINIARKRMANQGMAPTEYGG